MPNIQAARTTIKAVLKQFRRDMGGKIKISPKLISQMEEFAAGRGPKLAPEETAKALTYLQGLGRTEVGRARRGALVEKLKGSGLLEDPAVERAYAFGSAVTGKEKPSDLDVLIRLKEGVTDRELSRIARRTSEGEVNVIRTSDVGREGRGEKITKAAAEQAAWLGMMGTGLHGTAKHKWVRLVGVAGAAVGAASLLGPSEAEALPPGVYKQAAKGVKGAVSSAAKRLVGYEVQPGKIIQNVFKGRGKWRTIVFEDGTESIVKTSDINNLSRAVGTQKYTDAFRAKGVPDRTTQAMKSLKFHEVRAQPFFQRRDLRRFHKTYLDEVGRFGEEIAPNTVSVTRGNKYFQMPRSYAEHLEEMGVLKIMKGKVERGILKPKPGQVRTLEYDDKLLDSVLDAGPEGITDAPVGWTGEETFEQIAEILSGDFSAIVEKEGRASLQEVGRSLRQLNKTYAAAYENTPAVGKTPKQWEQMAGWLRQKGYLKFRTSAEAPFEVSPKDIEMLKPK